MRHINVILILLPLLFAGPAMADTILLNFDDMDPSRLVKHMQSQSMAVAPLPVGPGDDEDDIDLEAVVNPPLPTPNPFRNCPDCSSSLAVDKTADLRKVADYAAGFSCGGVFQSGEASWYGEPFHGRKTASGEVYNMWEMTAAHKTLDIPRTRKQKNKKGAWTWVKVTNRKTKKSVFVRITDRGPYHGGRIIDLSKKAMSQIGGNAGTVQVALQVCDETGRTSVASKD